MVTKHAVFTAQPPMVVGMGWQAAYFNGFKHGFEGVNTENICCLTIGSHERESWLAGYKDGENAANEAYPEGWNHL